MLACAGLTCPGRYATLGPPVDNKRKGSDPQQSPSGSDRFDWDEPPPKKSRDSFNFDDDEDSPLPAPPEFDGERGSVPDLLDGEEVVEEADRPEPHHHQDDEEPRDRGQLAAR